MDRKNTKITDPRKKMPDPKNPTRGGINSKSRGNGHKVGEYSWMRGQEDPTSSSILKPLVEATNSYPNRFNPRHKKPEELSRGNGWTSWTTNRTPFRSHFESNRGGFSKNSSRFNNNPHIGLKKLEELLAKTPEDIILTFQNPHFRLEDYLSAPTMGSALIHKLAIILNKAFESNSVQLMMRNQIEKIVESAYFTRHLYDAIYQANMLNMNSYNLDLIEITIKICCRFLMLQPYCQPKLGPIIDRLEILVTNRLNNQRLKELFEQIQILNQEALKRIQETSKRTFSNVIDFTNIEPPDDFTQLNIVPKFSDILSDKINQYLRKNITNGAYNDVKHYLDVQFRLLREDFLRPLREGVQKLREIIREARLHGLLQRKNQQEELTKDVMHRIRKIESLSAYFDCSIEDTIPTELGIAYQLRLSQEKTKAINWDASKKLLFGSIVCLSNDYFDKCCLVGSICERDPKKLKKGIIYIKFNIDFENQWVDQQIPFGGNFILLETSAFFESYKHVLQAFVSFDRDGEENFPFKENLVYCRNQLMPMPKYLTNMPIDMRPLVEKRKIKYNHLTKENEYHFSPKCSYAEKCYLSNQASWPTAAQMGLDSSQYEAIKLALENKLALIQGPPGTGKTFIGVKIVELLLHNKNTWWNRALDRHRPILMICYTNHALDQFLEYCISECGLNQGVVRVGGQSKSENLNSFKLANIKFNLRRQRQIDGNIHHRIMEERSNLQQIKHKLENISKLVGDISFGKCMLRFNALEQFMDPEVWEQFKFDEKRGDNFCLLDWLGFFGQESAVEISDDDNDDLKSVSDSLAAFSFIDDTNSESEFAPSPTIISNNSETVSESGAEILSQELDSESDLNETLKEEDEEEDTFSDVNDEENNERMLEDDTEWQKELEKIEIEKYKESKLADIKKIQSDVVEFKEIEDIRDLLNLNKQSQGWQTVGHKKDRINGTAQSKFYYSDLCRQSANIDLVKQNIHLERNIFRLDYPERFALYLSWVDKYKESKQEEMDHLADEYNKSAQLLQELRLQEDRSILQDAYIVAMTTTGSSRYHSVLKDIGPRIVIVEEAAEVFESHIVASLSKHCEHLILIGDHEQLKPNPAVYLLAKNFDFDVSLFERLINNDVKKVMLTCQHRMRPEISVLVRHFYKHPIQDNDSVLGRDSVQGLYKNIYFINHNFPEDRPDSDISTSKMNRFEAQYLAKLAQYFVKQKQFGQEKITILSMYLGQMAEIKKLLKNLFLTGVKCTTVDNFQGEENEIILLSLVRSNAGDRIGFLNVKNRVCVALSRARSGFYVIGNLDYICKCETGEIWKNIVTTLKERGSFVDQLTLTCGFHPENDISVKSPSDFDSRPNGGCKLPCEYRLSKCGHQCSLKCHRFDRDHKEYKCPKICEKTIERCGHTCKQICSHEKQCNVCLVRVEKKVPECGHSIVIRCDREPKRTDCKMPCTKILPCGHLCSKTCGESCDPCLTELDVGLTCKHGGTVKIKCSDKHKEKWDMQSRCPKKCNQILDCGHQCNQNCGNCLGGYIHGSCNKGCDRILFCGHKCQTPCSTDCQPCTMKCENRCWHSRCHKRCSDPCTPCQENCRYRCKHFKCTKKCWEICDRPPCNEPCPKRLKCGHQCIGFCGERCPRLCRICHKNKVCEIIFGSEDEPDARFVLLEDCGHYIESSAMDQWMETRFGPDAAKDTDPNNNSQLNSIELPVCPRCKTPIRRNLRYSKYVKIQMALIEQIKLKSYGDVGENMFKLTELRKEISDYLKPKVEKSSTNMRGQSFEKLFANAINDEINSLEYVSYNQLASYQNSWNVFVDLEKLKQKVEKHGKDMIYDPKFKEHFRVEFEKLEKYIFQISASKYAQKYRVVPNSGQRLDEILTELQRIEAVLNYYIVKNEARKVVDSNEKRLKIAQLLGQLEVDLIGKVNQYKGDVRTRVENTFKELKTLVNIELTQEEKTMIVAAMGLGKGHWYQCPNKHVYAIGECGGAMETSRCPECKAEIGGTQHRLTTGNQHAGYMDGSTRPSWPI